MCLLCPPGYECPRAAASSRTACLAGKYMPLSIPDRGVVACIACPAGTYSNAVAGTSVTVCSVCAAGKHSSAASTSCQLVNCPVVQGLGLATVYNDVSGVEGTSSCLYYIESAKSYLQARETCAALVPGAHLATLRQTLRGTGSGTDLLSVLTVEALVRNTAAVGWWLGATTASPSVLPSRWLWLDVTDAASNLRCGSRGCGLFCPSEPR
jgi:hypothetical protein